ncbi:glycosyltransferase [Ciceribacter thiooxidans]|uniref:Chitooligosaccharide deacetylase n=1 Tax=Ciceribacter thiooxidans TaxID=1969821 RepID=A0ABV7I2Z7_9HYPH|nr:glycosyltransferase [Ciceribacter thiooxidans]
MLPAVRHARGRRAKKDAPIFYAPGSRRGTIVKVGAALVLAFFVLWFGAFSVSLYLLGKLPSPGILRDGAGAPQTIDMSAAPPPAPAAVTPSSSSARTIPPQVFGYLPYWPEWSDLSLRKNLPVMDGLLPEWYRIALPDGDLVPLGFSAPHQQRIAELVARRRPTLTLLPVVELSADNDPETTAAALASPVTSTRIAEALAREVQLRDYDGICLDAAAVPETSYLDLARLLATLKQSFAPAGRRTCIVTPISEAPWSEPALAAVIDRYVVLAFQDPGDSPRPTPLAPQRSLTTALSPLAGAVPAEKLIVALGTGGYDWVSNSSAPRPVAFSEAARLSGLYGGSIRLDPVSLNPTTRFVDDAGNRHRIWMLDAASFHNQLVALSRTGTMPAVAVWPSTDADPAIWRLLDRGTADQSVQSLLKEVAIGDYVGYDGKGAFHKLVRAPETGIRNVVLDPSTGLVIAEDYARAAEPFTVLRYGAGKPGMVALTFDDGPDRVYTSGVLDELAARKAPATFFVIGKEALDNPDIIRRIVDDGHEIGVHTFSHPALENASNWRARMELNATERLIASLTGRQTLLFRSPYGRSEGPLTGAEAGPMRLLDQQGYIVAGADIVPPDWRGISADEIVASVLRDLKAGTGNVIVLHDGGGNRTATVEATALLVDTLRTEGYHFVTLADMLGLPADKIMPPAEGPDTTFDAISFTSLSYLSVAINVLFWVSVVAGIARVLFVTVASHLRRRHPLRDPDYAPPVTVLIPAYCEQDTIVGTVASVLVSDYPDLRVIVIDDGSTDKTCSRLVAEYGDDPRVRIMRQSNHGKYAALNHAYTYVETDIVVAIDADTTIAPDAIGKLVRHFRDPAVGAVAGNVKVSNRDRLLTRMQALEYITAQNMDRRAAERINGMLVVPGAIGAWRRKAVEEAGYYSRQTFAEDADLTVSVIRAGYKVVYEEGAIALTKAPTGLDRFLHQRLRWLFGMMQTGWKHRGAVTEMKGLGLVSITDLLLFGVVMTALAPLVDIIFLSTLIDRAITLYLDPTAPWSEGSPYVMAAYGAFILSDLAFGLMAFRFEKGEDKRLLLLLPLQRLFYRQLLCLSTYRAIALALTGQLMRWRKAGRAGISKAGEAVRVETRLPRPTASPVRRPDSRFPSTHRQPPAGPSVDG